MKINIVKTIIAVALSALLGLICYVIAPADELYRNWIAFGVTTGTLMLSLLFAMGIDYNAGYRTANIKLVSAIGTIIVLIGNVAFSCFNFVIPAYIAVMGIISLLFLSLTYSLIPKEKKQDAKPEEPMIEEAPQAEQPKEEVAHQA